MKTIYGSFDAFAVCECGWKASCHFGDLLHLTHRGMHIEVCPNCGRSKDKMKIKTLRPKYIKKAWWKSQELVCWEEKE